MYSNDKVFLNFPYDKDFKDLSIALQFSVVAKGLIPVCARDEPSNTPRIYKITDAIASCHYSIHDLSRNKGEGENNFIRGNMPLEAGMALFNAFHNQRTRDTNRFLIMTSDDHEQTIFASDLNGIDPIYHNNDEMKLILEVYNWLNSCVRQRKEFKSLPITKIKEIYLEFKNSLKEIKGGQNNEEATYEETRELMYRICQFYELWDFRFSRAGREEFPELPIQFKNTPPNFIQKLNQQQNDKS